LLNDLGESCALVPPVMQLSLELHPLLERVVHDVPIFLQFVNPDLVLLQLLVALALRVPDLGLELGHYIVAALLRMLL